MNCVLKTADMIKQVQDAVNSQADTKIIIENFQKRDGVIHTSDKSSVELDIEVKIIHLLHLTLLISIIICNHRNCNNLQNKA